MKNENTVPGTGILDSAMTLLDDMAERMKRDADSKIAVVGYAEGGIKTQDRVAVRRAINVKAYLISRGVEAGRIEVRTGVGGWGASIVWITAGQDGSGSYLEGTTPIDESMVCKPKKKRWTKAGLTNLNRLAADS